MYRRYRSLAGRIGGTAAVAWTLTALGATFAQPPQLRPSPPTAEAHWQNPIAASNRLTVAPPSSLPSAPAVTAAETTAAIAGPITLTTYATPPGPGRATLSVPPPAPLSVHWSAPTQQPPEHTSTLPVPERPMIPCELTPTPVAPVAEPPVVAEPPPQPPAPPSPTPTDMPPPRAVSSCRFVDEAPAPSAPPVPPAPLGESMIYAALRGTSGSPTDPDVLRQAIEDACHAANATDIQAEVVGDKQLRVTLTLCSPSEWPPLYARIQALPERGDHGILFRVRVKP